MLNLYPTNLRSFHIDWLRLLSVLNADKRTAIARGRKFIQRRLPAA